MMTRARALLSFALLCVAAAATGADPAAPSPRMLEGFSPEAAMDLANTWGAHSDENKVTTWTTSQAIHFKFPAGAETVIALPQERMVASVAPYIMKTHACREHFPSSCQGELANTPVVVKAVAADGSVVLEERTTTLSNGFVDLWLPRGQQIDVTLEARGLRTTQRIGTADSDKTCITEAKLHY